MNKLKKRLSGRALQALRVFVFASIATLAIVSSPTFKGVELDIYDTRMVIWQTIVQAKPLDPRVRLLAIQDSTLATGWSDQDSLQVIAALKEAGVEQIVVCNDRFFDDPKLREQLPKDVLALGEDGAQASPLFSSTSLGEEVFDRDGLLRSVGVRHPAYLLGRDLAARVGEEPRKPHGDRFFIEFEEVRGAKDATSYGGTYSLTPMVMEKFVRRSLDPEFVAGLKGKVVLLDLMTTEVGRARTLKTASGLLVVSQVYACIVNTFLDGWNLYRLGWFGSLLVGGALMASASYLLSGRRPWMVTFLGSLIFGGVAIVSTALLPFSLDAPVGAILTGIALVIMGTVFMEFRRSNRALKSYGGSEDALRMGEETRASIVFTILPKFLFELEKRNDEHLLRYRRDYNTLLEQIARKYHGRVLDFQGDAQMIGFGLRHDEDAEHPLEATAAALEMVAMVPLLAERWEVSADKLKVHAGVCSGTVALGHVGAADKKDIAAIGDTTNTAARLMGAAMKLDLPVVIAKATHECTRGLVSGEPLPAVELKGKSAPVEVFEAREVDEAWRVGNVSELKSDVPVGGTLEYSGERRSDLAVTLAFAGAMLAVMLVLSTRPLAPTIETRAYDALHSSIGVRGGDPRIIIAGIDESCFRADKLGAYPWSRGVYAQVIENLKDSGYEGLFVDVMFKRARGGDPEGDEALARALASDPRAVIGAVLPRNEKGRLVDPEVFPAADREELRMGNQLGLLHKRHDDDERVRWAILAATEEGSGAIDEESGGRRAYPTAAVALLAKPGEKIVPGLNGLMVGERLLPATPTTASYPNELLIRFGPRRTGKLFGEIGGGAYHYIPFWRLLDPSDPILKELQGKYIFVGHTANSGDFGQLDIVSTPVGLMKGVEAHARTFDTILNEDFISRQSPTAFRIWLVFVSLVVTYILAYHRSFEQYAPRLLAVLALHCAIYVGAFVSFGYWTGLYFPIFTIIALCLAVLTGRYLLTFKALASFVPAEVANEILYHHQVRDRRLTATVLLTDIRGYTTLSEGRSAVAMLDVLNEYHKRTVACYKRHGGQALTYQGDAQIVVFGVFGERENPARDAVAAALELQAICDQLREEWGIERRDDFDVGAGLCTGEIEVGRLGGDSNKQVSVVGETVRKSHKVQSLSDELSAPVLLDEETYEACRGMAVVDDLGMVHPKGLEHEIRLYRARAAEGTESKGKGLLRWFRGLRRH